MELEVMEAECERLVGLGELVVTDDPRSLWSFLVSVRA
jgi:hypothetical protein